jgi:hypothetical protein
MASTSSSPRGQVRQPVANAGERAGEAVHVAHVAHSLLALQPVLGDLTLMVEAAQLRIAVARRGGHRAELLPKARILTVDRDERIAQLGEEPLQPHQERRVAVEPGADLRVLGAHFRAHRVDVLHDAAFYRLDGFTRQRVSAAARWSGGPSARGAPRAARAAARA